MEKCCGHQENKMPITKEEKKIKIEKKSKNWPVLTKTTAYVQLKCTLKCKETKAASN